MRGAGVVLVLVVLLWSPALEAQQPPVDTTRAPFVPGGIYDKPYLTTLLGRTALGGYAEADASWPSASTCSRPRA